MIREVYKFLVSSGIISRPIQYVFGTKRADRLTLFSAFRQDRCANLVPLNYRFISSLDQFNGYISIFFQWDFCIVMVNPLIHVW